MPTFIDIEQYLSAEIQVNAQVVRLLEGRRGHDMSRGGDVVITSGNPRLWTGQLSLIARSPEAARALSALGFAIQDADTYIRVRDYGYRRPDLPATTASLTAVSQDRKTVRIGGLAPQVDIRVGDYLGFTYIGKQAHHIVTKGARAGTAGNADIEVMPKIREGFELGSNANLRAPSMLAIPLPGGVKVPTRDGYASGPLTIEWMQVLEATI